MKLGLGIGFYLATGAIAPTPPAYDYLVTSDAELTTVLANSDATLSGKTIAFADGTYSAFNINGRTFTSYLVFKSLNPASPYGGGALIEGFQAIGTTKFWLEDLNFKRPFTLKVSNQSTSHVYIDGCDDFVITGNDIYGDQYPGSSSYDYATSNWQQWEQDTSFWLGPRWPLAEQNYWGIGSTSNENTAATITGNRIRYVHSGIRGKFKDGSVVAYNLVSDFYNVGVGCSGDPIQDYTESWNVVTKGIAQDEDYGNNNAFEANWTEEKTDSTDGFNQYWEFTVSGSQWTEGNTLTIGGELQTGGSREARVRAYFVGPNTTQDSAIVTGTGSSYEVAFLAELTMPASVTAVRVGIYNEPGTGQTKMTRPFLGSRAYGPHSSPFAFTPGTKTIDYDNIVKQGNVAYGHYPRADHSGMKLDDLTGAGRYTNCKLIGNFIEGHANISMEICNPYQCTIENNTVISTFTGETPGIKFTDESHSLSSASYTGNRCANNIVGLGTIVGSVDFEVDLVNELVATIGSNLSSVFDGPFTAGVPLTNPFTQCALKAGGAGATAKPLVGAVGTIVSWPANFLTTPAEGTVTDDQPDNMNINSAVDAPLSTVTTSSTGTIKGNTTAASFSVGAGLTYSKNGGAYGSSSTTLVSGDTITLRATSSSSYGTQLDFTYTIAGLAYTWSVTTEAEIVEWPNVSGFTYDSVSLNMGATYDSAPTGVYVSPNGANLYVCGDLNNKIYRFSMSTPFSLATASYVSEFLVQSQDTVPEGVTFKNDGTKMFVVGSSGDAVYEYALASAWDITSATYTTSFSTTGQDASPQDIYFKSDGTKFWIVGLINDTVYQYSCSTPWDISTASYDSKSFSVNTQESAPRSLYISDDGTKLYILGQSSNTVFQYTMSTAFDVSTASYDSNSKSVSAQETTCRGLWIGNNGTKMLVTGSGSDAVYSYSQ